MDKSGLPFKVDQLAESRSFITGFRGAWFRCRIKEIGWRKREMVHALEYVDFPDEKITWTKVYQKLSAGRKLTKRQLMVRPSFPPVYRESQMPDVNTLSEVVVIVNDGWKVGDLVDWLADGCYWSARVTEILGEGNARIELPPPPVGEGCSYKVSWNELRPSLDWSPHDGWTVPIPTEGENCHPCARLVKPVDLEGSQNLLVHGVDEVGNDAPETAGASLDRNASISSHISTSSLPLTDGLKHLLKRTLSPTACKDTNTMETNIGSDVMVAGIGKSSCSDSVSSSQVRDATAEITGTAAGKDIFQNSGSSEKSKNDESIVVNSLCSDKIEGAILDMEELVNRVKWIKRILQMGTVPSNIGQPSWKFLEHRSSSLRN